MKRVLTIIIGSSARCSRHARLCELLIRTAVTHAVDKTLPELVNTLKRGCSHLGFTEKHCLKSTKPM